MAGTIREYLSLLQGSFPLRRQKGTWETLARHVSIVAGSQGRYASEDGDVEEARKWSHIENAVYAITWGSDSGRLSGEAELALREMTEAQFLRLVAKVASGGGSIQTMFDGFKEALYKEVGRVAHRVVQRWATRQ
jgi:hypothetical protein